MKKIYLVDEDKFSGKIVVICRTEEVEVDVYQPTQDELLGAMYLYQELPEQIEKKTLYMVEMYYNFRLEDEDGTLLNIWRTYDKNEANEMFHAAVRYMK